MTRILVTGGAGAIGTALLHSVDNSDHEVVAIDRTESPLSRHPGVRDHDILSDDPLPPADVIVHLAAHSQVQPLIDDPGLAVENVETTRRVLDHATEHDAAVVLASSREVYGSAIRPIDNEVDIDAANPYAASKIASESVASAYQSSFDLDVVTLRFSNVYGPYDCNPRVVPIFISKAIRGEELAVFGDSKLLDFVYVSDAVDAIEQVVERREALAGETLTIGSGSGTRLTELAGRIVNLVDEAVGYSVEANRRGDTERFVANIEKASALLDFDPRPLSDGLPTTVEWYRERDRVRDWILEQL